MSAIMLKSNKQNSIIKEIASYYLDDDRPFAVGYSGGKDSTVVLDMVFKALLLLQPRYRTKTVFVQFSDTKMETDPVINGINNSFVAMQKFVDKYKLPVVIQRVEPKIEESFFTLLIGKGYQLPDTQNRWCTDRMKLRPQDANIKNMEASFEGVVSVVGSRHAESSDRSARLKAHTINGMLKFHDKPTWNMLTPIEHFSSDEVWSYIYTQAEEWVDAVTLGRQYAEAAGDGGECRTLLEGLEGEQAGCSKSARYGCWICPLFKKDKTLNNLTSYYAYMSKMEEFRNWLIAFREEGWGDHRRVYKNSKQARNFYTKQNHRNGMTSPSGFTLEWRKLVLERLWALNIEVVQYRHEPLISDAELVEIQKHWFNEGDMEMTVEKITGKKILEGVDEVRALSLYIKSHLYVAPDPDSIVWFESYYKKLPFLYEHSITDRFVVQMSMQLLERYSLKEALEIFLFALRNNYLDDRIAALPVLKMYHPSKREEEYIRKEWKDDKIGFMTFLKKLEAGEIKKPQANLFGYEGNYGMHFEQLDELKEKGDITLCESISLEDKMAFFENW